MLTQLVSGPTGRPCGWWTMWTGVAKRSTPTTWRPRHGCPPKTSIPWTPLATIGRVASGPTEQRCGWQTMVTTRFTRTTWRPRRGSLPRNSIPWRMLGTTGRMASGPTGRPCGSRTGTGTAVAAALAFLGDISRYCFVGKIYAYDPATKARVAAKEFDTLEAAGNGWPTGIWSDGATMWVADGTDDKIYAYKYAASLRLPWNGDGERLRSQSCE